MELENEKRQEEANAGQGAGSREGFRPFSQQGDYQPNRNVGRTPRPRIHTQRPYNAERTSYNKPAADEDSFRPEGFGSGLQHGGAQRPYRPRYNNDSKAYRPRYNSNPMGGEGGYQPRPYVNRNYQQGYGNSEEGQQYQQRGEGGYQPRQGGYQSRQGGYQPRQGDYQQQRTGGYQQPRQGGYQKSYVGRNSYQQGYGSSEDGRQYQQQRSYYGQRQPGQYQPRPYQQHDNYGQGGYRQGQSNYRPRNGGYEQQGKYSSFKKRIDYKEDNVDPNAPIRLNKYLANAGVCSRREADEYIQAGVVTVNGNVVTELGTKVTRSDEVKFHDQPVSLEKKVYVLLNKPKDYVTTSEDPQQRKTVMELVKNACPERIYPVGRLDRNTTGVLLLTNDGDLASKLTHPMYLKKKIYHVFLDKALTAHDLQQIRDGITLEDGEIKADDVQYADPVDKKQVGIEIHSGKNRIVRRIFEKLGYRVVKLDRVQFAGLTKKGVRRGDWRYLTEEEVTRLRNGFCE